jgi:cytochrome P450
LTGRAIDDPLWDRYVDEILRLDGSVMVSIRRFPAEPITYGGVDIPVGQPVLVGLAAANRDPERFDNPDELVPERGGGHLAFGAGAHYCPGSMLARAEIKAAVSALLDAHPGARLLDRSAVSIRPSVRTRGLKTLLVRSA